MQTFDDSTNTSMKLWTKEMQGASDSSGHIRWISTNSIAQHGRCARCHSQATALVATSWRVAGTESGESTIPDTLGETLLNDMCKSQK